MNSVHTMLRKAQLRWAWHVVCMSEERLPKQIFYGELTNGKRSLGGQRKPFNDTLKMSLKSFSINPDTWEATDAVNKGAARKMKDSVQSPGDQHTIPCPHCVNEE
jgi:hypothetical protein